MENRTYTMREVLILVDELLHAIEYNSAAPCNVPEQGDQATENEKLTLTVTEAAELLGISKPKMYELVRMNIFRSIKVGKKILIVEYQTPCMLLFYLPTTNAPRL